MEKSPKVLDYFGMDCGMLGFFKYSTHKPESKDQLLTFPHFWSTVWRKKIAVCAHTNRDPNKQEVGFIFV
jgi:hypothetical protein